MSQQNCLIADDSRMSRMMLKKIISTSHPDWRIIEAENGEEAVNKAEGQDLQIILLDFNMPIMDGGQAAEKLRPSFPKAKIAFLTANVQESIQQLAKDLQIDFIPKPITEEKIKQYVS
jgi:CheY-like chemotaxis protein